MRVPDGSIVEQSIEIECAITNNQAEYEALIAALKLAANIGARKLEILGDSQLVIQQMNREYETKDPIMVQYA